MTDTAKCKMVRIFDIATIALPVVCLILICFFLRSEGYHWLIGSMLVAGLGFSLTRIFQNRLDYRWFAIIAAVALSVDWSSTVRPRTKGDLVLSKKDGDCQSYKLNGSTVTPCEEKQRAFLQTEYATAIQELRQRSSQEQTLFALKFTLVGAILAALFGLIKTGDNNQLKMEGLRHNPLVSGFFWAAVIVSAILDARWQFNVVFISALGEWVTLQETINLGVTTNVLGWEHHLSHTLDATFYPLIRLSGTLLTVLLFAVAVVLFIPRQKDGNDADTLVETKAICLGAGLAAFVLFGLVSKSFQHDMFSATIHAVVWAVLGWYSLLRCLVAVPPPKVQAGASKNLST